MPEIVIERRPGQSKTGGGKKCMWCGVFDGTPLPDQNVILSIAAEASRVDEIRRIVSALEAQHGCTFAWSSGRREVAHKIKISTGAVYYSTKVDLHWAETTRVARLYRCDRCIKAERRKGTALFSGCLVGLVITGILLFGFMKVSNASDKYGFTPVLVVGIGVVLILSAVMSAIAGSFVRVPWKLEPGVNSDPAISAFLKAGCDVGSGPLVSKFDEKRFPAVYQWFAGLPGQIQ